VDAPQFASLILAAICMGMLTVIIWRVPCQWRRQVPAITYLAHVLIFYGVRWCVGINGVSYSDWSQWLRVHALIYVSLELFWRLYTWKPAR